MAGKAPRNKTTRSRPARPANKRYPETRMERGVLLAVGAVLAVAAVVVLAGLYITEYRPPRAHAVTIEGRDYSAEAVKRRGSYLVRYEAEAARSISSQDELVDATVDRLVRDEVLIRRAPDVVGEITDEDLDQQLRIQLGFATPTATPSPTPAPGATPASTSTATPAGTPTEVITPSAEERKREEADFARAQRDLYRDTGLNRDEFLRILKAQLYEARLRAKFANDLGRTAPQVKLQVIRVTDEGLAQRLRDQALQGSDFVRLAAQNSVLPTARQDGGELGWKLVSTLDEQVRAAVENLPKNGVSEIVRVDRFFEIYRASEPRTDRDIDATQRNTLLTEKFDDWLTAETPNIQVDRDMSDGTHDWIRDAIVGDVTDRGPVATPTPTATPGRG